MACLHPIPALDFGLDPNTGKHRIRMLPKRPDYNLQKLKVLYGDMLLLLPCGHCIECKKKYSSNWATRCALEAMQYSENYFITLTYDDVHLPDSVEKLKKDAQKFIRSIRDRGLFIRYFIAGERGEIGDRMHLHCCAFGLHLNDKKFYSQNARGDMYFTSELINSVWQKGFVIIGEFTYETARYTAGYTAGIDKKTLFTLSSRKPAIGYGYYDAHKSTMYITDHIELNGRTCPIPRSFDQLAEKESLPSLISVKEHRRLVSSLLTANEMFTHSFALIDYMFVERAEDIKAKTERRLKSGIS